MGFITKLQAVNQMLLASGESPVADLIGNSGIDTGIADTVLEQASLDFQLRGLANNKIVKKMNADSNGRIYLPLGDGDEEGVIAADLMSTHYNVDNNIIVARVYDEGTGASQSIKLYNFTDDTDIWSLTEDYYVEIIKKLKWSHLDTPTQRAILASAARHYQILTQGDSTTDSFLAYQEQLFSIKGRAADINDKKRNIFITGDGNVRGAAYRNPYLQDSTLRRFWQGGI
jgi:hypothetical protein